ncbi:MAG: Nif3-like dinuclear metal center hexameric protein [Candidatus Helarchaeota archaeon]
MTTLKNLLDKILLLALYDKKSFNIEKAVKIGAINSLKLEKKKIKKVLFCLDLTPDVVFHAVDNNIDIVFVHEAFTIWSQSNIQDELISIIKMLMDKNVYVLFFQQDSTINVKLNEFLVEVLGAKVDSMFNVKIKNESLPVGRIASLNIDMLTFDSFLDFVISKLQLEHVRYYQSETVDKLDKFIMLAGYPITHELLKEANRLDIKTILGEGLNYEILHYCQFYDINFIDITRFGLIKAFYHLVNLLKMEFLDIEFSFFDKKVNFSVQEKKKSG